MNSLGVEAIYGIIFKTCFLVWFAQFLKKKKTPTKNNKSKFSWLALLFIPFFQSKFSLIWVSKKRNDKESTICLTPKPNQSFFVYLLALYTKQEEKKLW